MPIGEEEGAGVEVLLNAQRTCRGKSRRRDVSSTNANYLRWGTRDSALTLEDVVDLSQTSA